uniref:PH01B001E05.9 protein n=1 Tax=Phyllostachys edulis TaxID=38705 RepID=L0P401_PHYED|nr:PH01B001E05.9 [Phyllostachys edulis]
MTKKMMKSTKIKKVVKSSQIGIDRSMAAQIVAQDVGGAAHKKRNGGTVQKKRDAMHQKHNGGTVRKKHDAMHKKYNGDVVRKKRVGLKSLGHRTYGSSKKKVAAAAMQRNSYAYMTDNKFMDSHGLDKLKYRALRT